MFMTCKKDSTNNRKARRSAGKSKTFSCAQPEDGSSLELRGKNGEPRDVTDASKPVVYKTPDGVLLQGYLEHGHIWFSETEIAKFPWNPDRVKKALTCTTFVWHKSDAVPSEKLYSEDVISTVGRNVDLISGLHFEFWALPILIGSNEAFLFWREFVNTQTGLSPQMPRDFELLYHAVEKNFKQYYEFEGHWQDLNPDDQNLYPDDHQKRFECREIMKDFISKQASEVSGKSLAMSKLNPDIANPQPTPTNNPPASAKYQTKQFSSGVKIITSNGFSSTDDWRQVTIRGKTVNPNGRVALTLKEMYHAQTELGQPHLPADTIISALKAEKFIGKKTRTYRLVYMFKSKPAKFLLDSEFIQHLPGDLWRINPEFIPQNTQRIPRISH